MRKSKINSFNFSARADENDAVKNGVGGRTVEIPHTWNVEDGTEDYFGTAWYSTELEIDEPAFKTVIYFHAVYRDCTVYLNGCEIKRHFGSGFTSFEADITDKIKAGKNLFVIKCSNEYSDNALPHGKDFDWANDGGIIRPVELIEYDKNDVCHFKIESTVKEFSENGRGNANVFCSLDFASDKHSSYNIYVKEKESRQTVFEKKDISEDNIEFSIDNAVLWNTENPFLYTIECECAGQVESRSFGIRKIEALGDKIYLNNREIKLIGVEWMPGSHPDFGMAEPESELIKNLEMLKDINCNFTRFHWQQDEAVYNWCDEHGLMVQEEIPYWGSPKNAGEKQTKIAERQADEMLLYHFNHPSIVCWGVGNELGARKSGTVSYVKHMVSYFKMRDSMRLVNYVSNTLGYMTLTERILKKEDATLYGDICMWNEYLGTWFTVKNFEKVFSLVKKQTEGKPVMVTEFGLCEPHFKGGDKRRIDIYKQKIPFYKKYGFNGWVYFSLNDYRTHVGETGSGRLKQRIHGSVDVYGNKKPSYDFIKAENKKDIN